MKKYESEKTTAEDGTWRHVRITLHPINPEFDPIDIAADDEGQVRADVELLEVLG